MKNAKNYTSKLHQLASMHFKQEVGFPDSYAYECRYFIYSYSMVLV